MGCHAFLQRIFPTQGSNPFLLHCRQLFFFTHIREAQRVLVLQSYPNRHSGKNSHWLIKSKEFFKGTFLPLMLQKVDFFLKIGLSSITL